MERTIVTDIHDPYHAYVTEGFGMADIICPKIPSSAETTDNLPEYLVPRNRV
jgi:hypothetical protein